MKPADVLQQIQAADTGPLYLIEGDDVQSRHDLAQRFTTLVDEGLQAFNVQSFYANEAANAGARDQMISDIIAAARTLPMMAPRRVLIVREADRLLSPRKSKDSEEAPPVAGGGGKQKRAVTPSEALEEYFESPEPLTTLVFVAGGLDGNRRLVKLLRKRAACVDCGTLDDPVVAAKWVKAYLQSEAIEIEPKAVRALLEATGLSLGRIRAAVERLVLYASGEKLITTQHVRDTTTPVDEPGDGPVIGYAIRDGNVHAALREVTTLLDSGAPHLPILGQIRWGAGLLRPDAKARGALELVLETDLALKSSAGEPRHLLEKLVIELCAR